jgi:hypothetical protein
VHVVVPIEVTKFDNLFHNLLEMLAHDTTENKNSKGYKNEIYYHPSRSNLHDMFINPHYGEGNGGPGTVTNVSIRHEIDEIQEEYRNVRLSLPLTSKNVGQHGAGQRQTYLFDPQHELPFNTTGAVNRRQRREILLSRKKRFWPALIGALIGSGIMGTFMGIFNNHQVQSMGNSKNVDLLVQDNQLKNRLLDNLGLRIQKALIQQRSHAGDMIFVTRYFVWETIIRHVQRRVDDFTSLVDDLHKHRLSQRWFSHDQIKELHRHVKMFATQHNVFVLTEFPSDYYQIDVSFVSSKDQLLLLLHVPATRTRDKWAIYRYHPFPIPDGNRMMTMITAPEPLIALGNDKKNKILSESALHKCLQRNHYYLCSSPVVTSTNFESSCVGGLMGQHADTIKDLCDIRTEHEREVVMQASERTFAVFSPEIFTARGSCLNGSFITRHISHSSIVELPPGCNLQLKGTLIDVPFSITTPREPIIHPTNWDTLTVPRAILRELDHRQTKLYQLLANDSADNLDFQDGLRMSRVQLAALHDRLSREVQENHSSFIQYFVILGITLLLLMAILALCWCGRYWCSRPPVQYEIEMSRPPGASDEDPPHILQHVPVRGAVI